MQNEAEVAEASSGGKAAVEQWLFGQVMRRMQGRGNPQVIRRALGEKLEALKQKRTQG